MRKAELEPRWLVGLLNQWAIHSLRSETGGLGYASGSAWMRGLKASPASSIDPTGFAARDFRDIDAAMTWLLSEHRNLWASVTMYYKPWVVESFKNEGYPFGAGNKTYYNRLHEGHAKLSAWMNERASNRAEQAEHYRQGLARIVTDTL